MPNISDHAKERSIQRVDGVETVSDAKKYAKQARLYGSTLNDYQRYPKFFGYLQNKKNQTRTCTVRVYKNNIYIWRGKLQTLVTVHPIPDRYMKEMEAIDSARHS